MIPFPTVVCCVFIKVVLNSIVCGWGGDNMNILVGGAQAIKVYYKLILDLPNWQPDITEADLSCTFPYCGLPFHPPFFFCSFFSSVTV